MNYPPRTALYLMLAFWMSLCCGDGGGPGDDAGSRITPDAIAEGPDDTGWEPALDVAMEDAHDVADGIDTGSFTCSGELQFDTDGLVMRGDCPGVNLHLRPAVRLDGEWLGGGEGEGCTVREREVVCPAGEWGEVAVILRDEQPVIRFRAADATNLEALALVGHLEFPGATAWLSNGFQSWSPSGVIGLGPPLSEETVRAALLARGDGEVLRSGPELSWWYTFVGGGAVSLVMGVTSAARFKSWVQVHRLEEDRLSVRLVNGGAGEQIEVESGSVLEGEPWHIRIGGDLAGMLRDYALGLDSRRFRAETGTSAGWNSWYDLWDDVDETDIRENAVLASAILGPLLGPDSPPLRIVIDDGWQKEWGIWEPNDKFPSGLDGLAADLRDEGYQLGVWLAPLLVSASSDLARDHPDWFVGGAEYLHAVNGRMLVLDVSHPDAAAHLSQVIERLVSWGYDLLKIDFLFTGTYEGSRFEPLTGMESFARALTIIRQAAGEETELLGVGCPGLASFPYVDAWRLGGDIALEPLGPSWAFILGQGRNLGARWHLCTATYCDADPILLRDLAFNEVDVGAWFVTFASGALFLSDDLRMLPVERHSWVPDRQRLAIALGGEPAVPRDLVPDSPPLVLASTIADHLTSTSSQRVPLIWRLPDGRHVAVNSTDQAIEIDSVRVAAHRAVILP